MYTHFAENKFRKQLIFLIIIAVLAIFLLPLNTVICKYLHFAGSQYIFGISIIPLLLAQTLTAILAKYSGTYFYDKQREGLLGQQYIRRMTAGIGIIFTLILNSVGCLAYHLSMINSILLILISVIGSGIIYYLSAETESSELISVANEIVIIQALQSFCTEFKSVWDNALYNPDVNLYLLNFKSVKWSISLPRWLSFLLLLLISVLLIWHYQVKKRKYPLENLGKLNIDIDDMFLYLPYNTASIVPLLLVLISVAIIPQYIKDERIVMLISYLILIISNIIYSVVNKDPEAISDTLQERNSYLTDDSGRIILAGEKTEKYLRKRLYLDSAKFSLPLTMIYVLCLMIDNVVNQSMVGINLVLSLMIAITIFEPLLREIQKNLILISVKKKIVN